MNGYTIKSWLEFVVTVIISFSIMFGKMLTFSMLAYVMYRFLDISMFNDTLNSYLIWVKASAVYMFCLQLVSALFKQNKDFDNSSFESVMITVVDNFISEILNLLMNTTYICLSMYLIILIFC